MSDLELLLEKKKLLERQVSLQEGLPFLYGWRWYPWARRFFESRNKMTLLVAANQISKSSTQIRKCIDWATNTKIWPSLWERKPLQFWYLYPTKETATIEFEKKWKTEFLPRGEFKDHPIYGWKEEYRSRNIFAIHFHSGVSVYFKTYAQDAQHLQSGTCYAIFCFVAGTKIASPGGSKNVEDIRVGDWVYTHKGLRRVKRTQSRESEVLTRQFTNGASLTGTYEHPMWTENRGWVQFGQLTPEDICHSVPECEATSKLSYLKDNCTPETLNTQISGNGTTSGASGKIPFTSLYGRVTTSAGFQKARSFITKTISRSTTASKILSALRGQNTLGTIKRSSGEKNARTLACASAVAKALFPEALTKWCASAGERALGLLGQSRYAANAAKKHFTAEKTRSRCSVLSGAPTKQPEIANVYNIEVEDAHTYYANGILVHNCDEELPEDIFDELMFRLAATDGYFSMVFTATLGQEMWADAMEGRGAQEKFPESFKQQVSMYDCLCYEDGTPSHWSEDKIERIKNKCKSPQEIQRRVYGRFVLDSGLKYPSFNKAVNFVKPYQIPPDWRVYTAVDIGSGGKDGHPAAISFVAVRPDYRKGAAFKLWRGDGIQTVDADILEQHTKMKHELLTPPVMQVYDWQAKDFFVIAARTGETFVPADKSHDRGESILNVLFKNNMLDIFDTDDGEGKKLCSELVGLLKATSKNKAKDDLCDTLRYNVVSIPWDWDAVTSDKLGTRSQTAVKTALELQIEARRGAMEDTTQIELDFDIGREIEEWNELY